MAGLWMCFVSKANGILLMDWMWGVRGRGANMIQEKQWGEKWEKMKLFSEVGNNRGTIWC